MGPDTEVADGQHLADLPVARKAGRLGRIVGMLLGNNQRTPITKVFGELLLSIDDVVG